MFSPKLNVRGIRCYSVNASEVVSFGKNKKSLPTIQWNAMKKRYPSHLIFFRFGAFYELLGNDAVVASDVLNIRLNSLRRAGFPYHSIQNFVPKLIHSGHKIAVIEETNIVRRKRSKFRMRECIGLLSPSTYHLFINNDEDDGEDIHNYNPFIVSITNQANEYCSSSFYDLSRFKELNKNPTECKWTKEQLFGLCIMHMNISKIEISHSSTNNLIHDLSRINPSEILLCARTAHDIPDIVSKLRELFHVTVSDQVIQQQREDNNEFDDASLYADCDVVETLNWSYHLRGCSHESEDVINNNIKNIINSNCDQFSSKLQLSATCLLMLYLKECKVNIGREFVNALQKYENKDILFMDASTRRALEITHSLYDHNHVNSLINNLNKTNTLMGKRLLKQRLSSPITNIGEIEKRVKCNIYMCVAPALVI